jgi:hypothetical protein
MITKEEVLEHGYVRVAPYYCRNLGPLEQWEYEITYKGQDYLIRVIKTKDSRMADPSNVTVVIEL